MGRASIIDGISLQLMTNPEQITPEVARTRLRAFLAHIESQSARGRDRG